MEYVDTPKKRRGLVKGSKVALDAGKKATDTKRKIKEFNRLWTDEKINRLWNEVFKIKIPPPPKPVKVKPTAEEQLARKRAKDREYNKTRPTSKQTLFLKAKDTAIKEWEEEQKTAKKAWVSIRFKRKFGITIPELILGKFPPFMLKKIDVL